MPNPSLKRSTNGRPLSSNVSPLIFRFMQASISSSALPFSSIYSLGLGIFAGLRLGALRQLKQF